MVKVNDLVVLKAILKDTKVGKMSNEALRAYLKLSLTMNKYASEFEDKRTSLITDTVSSKGYDIQKITPEQDREIFNVIAPILDEFLGQEVDIETKVLSWDDICNGILNLEDNEKLSVDDKTKITQYLCKDEL